MLKYKIIIIIIIIIIIKRLSILVYIMYSNFVRIECKTHILHNHIRDCYINFLFKI